MTSSQGHAEAGLWAEVAATPVDFPATTTAESCDSGGERRRRPGDEPPWDSAMHASTTGATRWRRRLSSGEAGDAVMVPSASRRREGRDGGRPLAEGHGRRWSPFQGSDGGHGGRMPPLQGGGGSADRRCSCSATTDVSSVVFCVLTAAPRHYAAQRPCPEAH